MSSLRNAVKRITHKERSQPQSRAHLGFLEKKIDYKKRADVYHKKEDRLKVMQRKASMKNPDEFYFGMKNAQIKDGYSHQKTQEAIQKELADQIGADAVKIMKSQDLTYVRLQKQRDIKKVQRLKESLHLIGNDSSGREEEEEENRKKKKSKSTTTTKGKHTIFIQSKEQAQNFDVATHFDTPKALIDRTFNRPRKSKIHALAKEQLGYTGGAGEDDEEDSAPEQQHTTDKEWKRHAKMLRQTAKNAAKARSNAYEEMEARAKRAATMELAEAHLVTEKLVAGKGRKRKIKPAEDGKPAQYKWRRKRKR